MQAAKPLGIDREGEMWVRGFQARVNQPAGGMLRRVLAHWQSHHVTGKFKSYHVRPKLLKWTGK